MRYSLSWRCGASYGLAFTLLISSAAPAADTLTLDEVRRLAVHEQPTLAALTAAAEAARASAISAGQLADPQLTAGIQNLPVSGANALQLARDDFTMLVVGIAQDVTPRGTRAAATQRAEAEGEQWLQRREAEARALTRDAALAWVDACEAQQRITIYQRLTQEFRAQREIAAQRLAADSGSADGSSVSQIFALDIQLATLQDQQLQANGVVRKARATLARWLGAAAARPLPETFPALPTPPDNNNIDDHPLVSADRYQATAARYDAQGARAAQHPDWGWQVMYGRRPTDGANLLTAQVSVKLPWDRAQRQDRRLAEKLALQGRAESTTEEHRRALQAEWAAARADWDTAVAREAEHLQHLFPLAQARLTTLQAGYAAGQTPLPQVWEARRALVELEMDHTMIRADEWRAALRLDYLSGKNVP